MRILEQYYNISCRSTGTLDSLGMPVFKIRKMRKRGLDKKEEGDAFATTSKKNGEIKEPNEPAAAARGLRPITKKLRKPGYVPRNKDISRLPALQRKG